MQASELRQLRTLAFGGRPFVAFGSGPTTWCRRRERRSTSSSRTFAGAVSWRARAPQARRATPEAPNPRSGGRPLRRLRSFATTWCQGTRTCGGHLVRTVDRPVGWQRGAEARRATPPASSLISADGRSSLEDAPVPKKEPRDAHARDTSSSRLGPGLFSGDGTPQGAGRRCQLRSLDLVDGRFVASRAPPPPWGRRRTLVLRLRQGPGTGAVEVGIEAPQQRRAIVPAPALDLGGRPLVAFRASHHLVPGNSNGSTDVSSKPATRGGAAGGENAAGCRATCSFDRLDLVGRPLAPSERRHQMVPGIDSTAL